MKKKTLIVVVLVVVLLGTCGYFFLGTSVKHKIGWETTRIERHSLSNMVTATGTIEPVTKVDVGTQVSGIIDRLYVDYNSVVKKGQLLAEMDKVTLQADLESQEAQLASAKTEYEYQQKNYARNKVLFEKKLTSDTDYELATYSYEKAKASYEKAQADIIKVRRNLGYAVITSPIDGVVTSKEVEEGQTVAAGFSTPTLFTIAKDLTEMQVVADVDEADIGQVEEGQRVTFEVDAYPNDVFEGKVTQVRLESTVTSNVVTYEVVISAPNPDLKLKPGLTANVSVYTLEKDNVLAVASKALRFVPDEDIAKENGITLYPLGEKKAPLEKTVWMKDGQGLREKAVSVGTNNGALTEIIAGVAEGEEVIVGMAVAAKNAPATTSQGETSPFMPKHPGQNSKAKTEK